MIGARGYARRCRGHMPALLAAFALLGAGATAAQAADGHAPARSAPGKLGVASSKYLVSNPGKLTAIGATWSYDWASPKPAHLPAGLQWVPMIWGAKSLTPQVLKALRADARSGATDYLLGFNEPDSSSQSNMTPTQAADLWPQLESTGLELGSPAVATPSDGWLAQFMKLVRQRHLRVDFIALHYYQDYTNPAAVAQLRSQLIGIHNTYHLPIWVTEVGALDIRSWGEPMAQPASEALVVTYMRRLFTMLNALPFVQRYAWFTDNCWSNSICQDSSLFDGSGRLTPPGASSSWARN